MATHSVLRPKPLVDFDPKNPEHQKMYADFRTTGRWQGDVRFMLQEPHEVIPTMCEQLLVKHFLQVTGIWAKDVVLKI